VSRPRHRRRRVPDQVAGGRLRPGHGCPARGRRPARWPVRPAPHLPADHRRHELHAPGGVEVEAEADIQADPAVTLLVKGQRLSGTTRIIPPPDPGYGRLW